MKVPIPILAILLFSTGCEKTSLISLTKSNHNKIVSIQPLDDYDEESLSFIGEQISSFFHVRVIISQPINIPKNFYNQEAEAYSADSLLKLLSQLTNDSVVEVIGITRKEIYVTREYKFRENNKDVMPTFPKKVFGFGYVSGNACVISDFKLVSADIALLNNRLRKVTLHEIGHNLGLQHCNDNNCIMSESNGNIGSLNKTGGDYCEKCKRKLN